MINLAFVQCKTIKQDLVVINIVIKNKLLIHFVPSESLPTFDLE